jgi:hypothetical protein
MSFMLSKRVDSYSSLVQALDVSNRTEFLLRGEQPLGLDKRHVETVLHLLHRDRHLPPQNYNYMQHCLFGLS